jgi:hypothetical protein
MGAMTESECTKGTTTSAGVHQQQQVSAPTPLDVSRHHPVPAMAQVHQQPQQQPHFHLQQLSVQPPTVVMPAIPSSSLLLQPNTRLDPRYDSVVVANHVNVRFLPYFVF